MPLPTSGDPPRGYLTVSDAQNSQNIRDGNLFSIIGVVVDCWDPKETRGSDMMVTFRIRDKSIPGTSTRDGFKVRNFFPKRVTDMPLIHVGDLVIIRDFKMTSSGFERVAISNMRSQLVILPEGKIPAPIFNDEFVSGTKLLPHEKTSRDDPPTSAEQMYAIALHHAFKQDDGQQITHVEGQESRFVHVAPETPQTMASGPSRFSAKEKFRLLSDCEEKKFCDLAVEVVKKFPQFDRCEIYVTDYTENPRFYDYNKERGAVDGDPFNFTEPGFDKSWKGPHGQRTIQILLFEPHSSHCLRNIAEGDLVFLRNVHIKFDRNGSKLEGVLHQDKKYPDRYDIIKPQKQDPRMADLMSRREKYWKQFKNPAPAPAPAQESKKQRKKRAQKERLQARKEQEAEKSESDAPQGGSNTYVVTERTHASPTRLADMIDNAHYNFKTSTGVEVRLPFINAKFRTQVRVVDFHPPDLRDFSRSLSDPSYNNMPAGDTQSTTGGVHTGLTASPPRWEWAFYLLIEDATQPQNGKENVRIPLLVADKDAEYLLKLDPTDLRRDGATLNALSNKLWALWGNLEEVKASKTADEAHQAKPFECLVKQYGVEVPWDGADAAGLGFHRMFRMFGTTIKE
ncbi:hypothetical protein IWZ01DRAFT_506918 [Phyllosticta capitalensis]